MRLASALDTRICMHIWVPMSSALLILQCNQFTHTVACAYITASLITGPAVMHACCITPRAHAQERACNLHTGNVKFLFLFLPHWSWASANHEAMARLLLHGIIISCVEPYDCMQRYGSTQEIMIACSSTACSAQRVQHSVFSSTVFVQLYTYSRLC